MKGIHKITCTLFVLEEYTEASTDAECSSAGVFPEDHISAPQPALVTTLFSGPIQGVVFNL